MKNHSPAILAIVLLLLPVLYVGSYLAMVGPRRKLILSSPPPRGSISELLNGGSQTILRVEDYRWGGSWSARIFWPLEQIDRKVRPGAWPFYLEKDSDWIYEVEGEKFRR